MINRKIENIVSLIREARDEADNLEERILFFVAFLLIGFGAIAVVSVFLGLAFTFPKVFIPIYLTIFILWQVYKRL